MQPMRLAEYELLELIGRGGMAEVYKARAVEGKKEGRLFAVKRLRPDVEDRSDVLSMFAGEADVCRYLEHPNIIKVHEVGMEGPSYFLVMELIDGRDLSQLLQKSRKYKIQWPIDFCVYLVHTVLDALDYAHHAKGPTGQPLYVVHGDISPSNIFIGRQGDIKLGDFGVARMLGDDRSFVFGKPYYLSPESLDGEVDAGDDLWAAAVMLYEILTLRRPFAGNSPDEVFVKIRTGEYLPVRQVREDIPAGLAAVVARALEVQKSARFETAAQFRDALREHFDERIGTPLAISSIVRGLFGPS